MAGVGTARIAEVVRMRLAGASITKIARTMGVSCPSISDTLKRPEVAAQIAEANADSYALIADQRGRLAVKALKRLERQLDSDDERIAQGAANSILDRCGVTKETAIRFPDGPPVVVTATDLVRRIAERLTIDVPAVEPEPLLLEAE